VFEALTERLQAAFSGMARRGTLQPGDIEDGLRQVRLALLEADVNYQVAKDLLERVAQQALDTRVARALNPTQQVIKILNQELILTLGEPGRLRLTGKPPRILLLVGLQGSGKTTTAAKLGAHLRARGERVGLLAADPYRPAAVTQLGALAERVGVPLFGAEASDAQAMAATGMEAAIRAGITALIVDSAGRSQLDAELMQELVSLRRVLQPVETLLVADAMTGQQSVNIAQGFHQALGLTGLVLTKMDGDARGGAAISMRSVTGVPIKYLGVGEGIEALEVFEPSRLASRILGMGDVLGLIEKAEAVVSRQDAEAQAERLLKGEFTLDDFAAQLVQVRSLGPIGQLLDMLPANVASAAGKIDSQVAQRQLDQTLAIIRSMTAGERRRPDVLDASRKRRVAAGSGTSVQQVNQLLQQYRQMRSMMKSLGKSGRPGKGRRLPWAGVR
jgi:signal recognition particle subunit SRP54